MPILGKKSYKPSPLPKDLKSEEEVFVIKETNEVFRSYEYPLCFLKAGFILWRALSMRLLAAVAVLFIVSLGLL